MSQYKNERSYLWGRVRRIVIPALDKTDYLLRWHISLPFGFAIYLHKILASDSDRDLHDHPWNFISLLVFGSYVEETPGDNLQLKRWINIRRATDLHRLTLFRRNGKEKPVYTIILRGRRQRGWGFQTEDGWKPWRKYNKDKFGTEVI